MGWRNIWGIPNTGNVPQPFPADVFWDITPKGELAVGYSEKYEIEMLDLNKGKVAVLSHDYVPVEVTEKDKDLFFAGMTMTRSTRDGAAVTSRDIPDIVKENAKFPKFKPAYGGIVADSAGNLLVFPYHKESKGDLRFFDAFGPKGDFIGSVRIDSGRLIPGYSASPIVEACFWRPEYDREGNVKIIKYRISG